MLQELKEKVLEQVAQMAYFTEQISVKKEPLEQYILDKYYLRKHGKNAYYGQKNYSKV